MKNIKEIQKEVDEIIEAIKESRGKKKGESGFLTSGAIKKFMSRKDYLNVCMDYLRTNPTTEFIQKEKDRLLKRNDLIMKEMPERLGKKEKRDYEKLMDLPKIRLQLRTLQFIS